MTHRARSTCCSGPQRAFTLLEIIVVLIIIGLLATMIVPRLSSTRKQEFELFVDRIADVLMMYAQRDNLGRTPIGLVKETSRDSTVFQVVVQEEVSENHAEWVVDRMVRPVSFPDFILPDDLIVTADGELVDITNWILGHVPGENRPALEINIRDRSGRYESTLVLSPYDLSPSRRTPNMGGSTRSLRIDLDSEGRSREDW